MTLIKLPYIVLCYTFVFCVATC